MGSFFGVLGILPSMRSTSICRVPLKGDIGIIIGLGFLRGAPDRCVCVCVCVYYYMYIHT